MVNKGKIQILCRKRLTKYYVILYNNFMLLLLIMQTRGGNSLSSFSILVPLRLTCRILQNFSANVNIAGLFSIFPKVNCCLFALYIRFQQRLEMEAKAQNDRFTTKAMELPMVSSGYHQALGYYLWAKEWSPLVNRSLSFAENTVKLAAGTAQPIVGGPCKFFSEICVCFCLLDFDTLNSFTVSVVGRLKIHI